MCGIAGLFDTRATREVDRAALRRMTDALEHRGPDGEGLHTEPGLGLGHRRLAIVDLDHGHQPIASRHGGSVMTFNGEVYNHRALRPALAKQGRWVRTDCDAEVLCELVDLRGEDALADLQGMFAFASWSPREETLLLARDRLGEKPLYWSLTKDGWLVFASEMAALLESGLVQPVIEERSVSDYLFYGYVPDPRTIYRGVNRMPAGHAMSVRRGRPVPQPRPWWRLSQAPDPFHAPEEAEARLLRRLDRAVEAQSAADVPLGAFLSGGVDSSAIVASMARGGAAPTTCTIGFDEAAADERAHARRVAELFGTAHHEEVATVDVRALIGPVARAYGEPFADSSALPTYQVCRLARGHVKVALSGDGADELFAGYARYGRTLSEAKVRRAVPGPLRRATFGPLGRAYPKLDFAPRPLRLKTTLQALGDGGAMAYARAVSAVLPDRCEAMLAEPLRGGRPERLIEDAFGAADTDDPLALAQAADVATWLPGRMLVKTDRASMRHGLEVRAPFLDHRLAEFAGALPRAARWSDGQGKRLLKTALEDRLPPETLYRPKQGFAAPTTAWFRAEGGTLTDDLLRRERWRDSGYLDVATVERFAKRHRKGRGEYGQELWSVLMFDAFLEQAG